MLTAFGWALAAGMLITGSINTLSTKAADLQFATNRYGESAYVRDAGLLARARGSLLTSPLSLTLSPRFSALAAPRSSTTPLYRP